MTKLPDGMPEAREAACCAGPLLCEFPPPTHTHVCDALTVAIESRDAAWAAERDRLAARLESSNDTVASLQTELRDAFAETEAVKARLAEVERERDIEKETCADWHNEAIALKAEVADLRKQLATAEARVWREAADSIPCVTGCPYPWGFAHSSVCMRGLFLARDAAKDPSHG